MAQQTAVEWLISQLYISEDSIWFKQIREQAKEMEKHQIESAWKRGDGEYDKVADKLAKQYYNETYTK
jgi:transcriptional regulator with PAS, ATPase and Fis domain